MKLLEGILLGKLMLVISFFLACEPITRTSYDEGVSLQIDSLIDLSNEAYRAHYRHELTWDEYLNQAFELAEETNNQEALVEIYLLTAKRFRRQSEFEHALLHLDKGYQIATEIANSGLMAEVLHEKAVNYRRLDEHGQALTTYVKTLELAESVNDTFLVHCTYNGMGNVYFVYKDYETAIDYFHKALRLTLGPKPNYTGQAINTNTLGESWLFLGNLDSALYYLNKSFAINEQIGSEIGKSICYNGLGMVYQEKGEYDKAIKAYKASISIHRHHDELIYAAMIMNSLGETYLLNNNITEAEEALKEAFRVSQAIGSKDNAFKASSNLAKLYEKQKLFPKALEYNNLGLAYKDSLTSELVEQNTKSIQTLYTVEKQERELEYLKQEAELDQLKYRKQQNIYIVALALGFLSTLIGLMILRQRKLKSQLQEAELEQKLNQVQMNPHFIFNSLSAIQSFIMRSDKFAASDYIANFSRLMRNILQASRSSAIPLESEEMIISDYVAMQQLRYDNKFDFEFTIDEKLSLKNQQVPPMLVQPFIENAIEHGLRNISYKGLLKVDYVQKNGSLFIQVEDNGVGLKNAKSSSDYVKHESLATEIVKERLKYIQSITKKSCSLKILDKVDEEKTTSGVRITLTVPIDY